MSRFLSDFRHALRAGRVRPLATTALIAILAVGTGLTATAFALADPFLLRPLPFADPDRLVTIRMSPVGRSTSPIPTLDDWGRRVDLFSAVTGFGDQESIRFVESGVAYQIRIMPVAANFFDVLGLRFSPPDLWRPGEPERVLLVSPQSQVATFARDEWRGRILDAGGGAMRVAGPLPASFVFPLPRVTSHPDALVAARLGETISGGGGVFKTVTAIARVRPGVSLQAVRASLSSQAGPSFNVVVDFLSDQMKSGMRGLALGALIASLLIALACAANAGNLVLTRVLFRRYEFDTRRALGASRQDIARLLVLELVPQVLASVTVGLGLAVTALKILRGWIPAEFRLLGEPAITGRVVGEAVIVAGLTLALLLVSSWLGARSLGATLWIKTDPKGARALRILMVSSQTATAIALAIGGSMLIKSYSNLWAQDTGFDWQSQLATVSFTPETPSGRVREDVDRTIDALRRLAAKPTGALAGPLLDSFISIGGPPLAIDGQRVRMASRLVTPDYFAAAGIQLKAGRYFSATDRPTETLIINDAFVRQYFAERDARSMIGERFERNGAVGVIIGVVRDVFDRALDNLPAPSIFQLMDAPDPRMPVSFAIGANADQVAPARIREVIQRTNPSVVVSRIASFDDLLAVTVRDRTFSMIVMALFAVSGVAVVATGVFAIVSFLAVRRTRELAIRLAIGASPASLRRLVIRETLAAGAVGLVLGSVLAVWAASFSRHVTYGVEPADPLVLASAIGAVLVVVVVASWLPTVRLLRLSPAKTLRAD